jgi:uncharacterized protein YebE (UPF0316 family)
MGFDFFSWVVVPLLIFLARVCDVSLGTLRFIFIAKGMRKVPPLLGFVEVLIWVLAVREVMVNLRNIACLLAYGGGFAMGNYVGMWLEEKLSIGMALVRVVFKTDPTPLTEFMKNNELGYTIVEGEGTREKVKILFSVVKRKNLDRILSAIAACNNNAFYTVENIRSASEGIFPLAEKSVFAKLFRKHRKSK